MWAGQALVCPLVGVFIAAQGLFSFEGTRPRVQHVLSLSSGPSDNSGVGE